MNRFPISVCRLASTFLLAGVACTSKVDIPASMGGTGGGSSTSTGGPASMASSTTSTASSTVASTGGSGGGAGVGPLACLAGERAIVAGTTGTQTVVSVQNQGVWSELTHAIEGPVWNMAASVDVYFQLNVTWVEQANGVERAHFIRTLDGTSVEAHDVMSWHPYADAPLFTVGDSILVGGDKQGASLGASVAYFDPDTFDWFPWVSTPFRPTSAAQVGFATLVGVSLEKTLCDLALDGSAHWGPLQCHPELPVHVWSDVPTSPPQIVALPNGDGVVVYHTSNLELAAAVLHEGKWSAPIPTKLPGQELGMTLAATPNGDVIVSVVLGTGEIIALRYSPTHGWGSPIAIDTGVHVDQAPSSATGICGDDALIAYVKSQTDGEIRVARVRGAAAETTAVAAFAAEGSLKLSLATRRSGAL